MKNKRRLVALLIPILIISLGVYGHRLFFDNIKGMTTTRLSFKFDGIDKGLNPHGGSFDGQQIKSEGVINKVVEELNLNIEPELLAKNIRIRGLVPKDAIDRIIPKTSDSDDINLEGIKGATYNPTQYEVSLISNKDFKINKKQSKEILDKLVEVYQNDFIETYKDTGAIEAAIRPIDPERYDYPEYIRLAEGQINIMKNYLAAKQKTAGNFKSSQTGLSFGDLLSRVELIEDIDIGNVKALVDSFMVTKDIDKLSIVSESMINKMTLEKEKYEKQADDLIRAATSYQKDKVLVSGSGELILDLQDNKDKYENKEDLYDKLVQQSIEARTRAERMAGQQEYYQALFSNIQNKQEEGSLGQNEFYKAEAEEGIEYIVEQMNTTMKDIKITTDDYYSEELFKGSVTPIRGVSYQSSFRANLIKDTLKVISLSILVIIIGYVFILTKEELSDR